MGQLMISLLVISRILLQYFRSLRIFQIPLILGDGKYLVHAFMESSRRIGCIAARCRYKLARMLAAASPTRLHPFDLALIVVYLVGITLFGLLKENGRYLKAPAYSRRYAYLSYRTLRI